MVFMVWLNIVMNIGSKVFIKWFFFGYICVCFSLVNFIVNIIDMVNLLFMILILINNSNFNL